MGKKSFIFQYIINWFYILGGERAIDQWSSVEKLAGTNLEGHDDFSYNLMICRCFHETLRACTYGQTVYRIKVE